MLQKITKEEKWKIIDGITLIALIITIIIILILAGVSVKSLIDVGAFDKTQKSVDDEKSRVEQTQNKITEITDDWNEIETGLAEQAYNLTINYIYESGEQAAPPTKATYFKGETFDYEIPEISEYVTENSRISGNMPAEDVTYTVNYMSDVLADPEYPSNSWRRRWNSR